MSRIRYQKDLDFTHELADLADAITLRRFESLDLEVSHKADFSPVTDADKAVEKILTDHIRTHRRLDQILGEEYGLKLASLPQDCAELHSPPPVWEHEAILGSLFTDSRSRCWIIDPIDSTRNFIRKHPVWGTLIALVEEDQVVVGLVSAPALGKRWWASINQGSFSGPRQSESTQIHVSNVVSLSNSYLSYSSLKGWRKLGAYDRFLQLHDQVERTRAFGDFLSYLLVAQGSVDIALEPELELYDVCALVPIVTEAGGKFTDLAGNSILSPKWQKNALATNSILHPRVLEFLKLQIPSK